MSLLNRLLILEKKLDKIDDKEIIKNLTDDESNYLLFVRLRLSESIGILYNYTQSIIVDDPQKFNENTKFNNCTVINIKIEKTNNHLNKNQEINQNSMEM